jgi:hypothetical protein
LSLSLLFRTPRMKPCQPSLVIWNRLATRVRRSATKSWLDSYSRFAERLPALQTLEPPDHAIAVFKTAKSFGVAIAANTRHLTLSWRGHKVTVYRKIPKFFRDCMLRKRRFWRRPTCHCCSSPTKRFGRFEKKNRIVQRCRCTWCLGFYTAGVAQSRLIPTLGWRL